MKQMFAMYPASLSGRRFIREVTTPQIRRLPVGLGVPGVLVWSPLWKIEWAVVNR